MKRLYILLISLCWAGAANHSFGQTPPTARLSNYVPVNPSSAIHVKLTSFIQDEWIVDPNPLFGGIAAGDGRGFGQPGSSRITHEFTLNTATGQITNHVAYTDVSLLYTWSGSVQSGYGDTSRLTLTSSTQSGRGPWIKDIQMQGASAFPLDPIAPDVRYTINFRYIQGQSSLFYDATVTGFPSFEMFVNNVSVMRLDQSSLGTIGIVLPGTSASDLVYINAPGGVFAHNSIAVPSLYLQNITWVVLPSGSVSLGQLHYFDLNAGAFVPLRPN